ncbi:MAG: biotin carboxyl carrier protein [Flavobacteriaceae bacterium]|jgi:biotin carboxyl carrier protein
MEGSYKAIVNDTYDFSISKDDAYNLDTLTSNSSVHVINNDQSSTVEIIKADFLNRNYIIKVNGNRYVIHIENELDRLITEMGLSLTEDKVASEIEAPMPGLIIDIFVSEGQEVKKGDFLCVLEAMKMENTLLSTGDGVVKSVKISKGQTVEKGHVIIEFEK